jgi:hypothetical protein
MKRSAELLLALPLVAAIVTGLRRAEPLAMRLFGIDTAGDCRGCLAPYGTRVNNLK